MRYSTRRVGGAMTARVFLSFVIACIAAFAAASPAAAACRWQTVPLRPLAAPGGIAAISALDAGDVWAVGSYLPVGGYQEAFAQYFDGTRWQKASVSGIALSGVKTFSRSDAWAVGIEGDSGFLQTLAEHWDGTSWRVVSTADLTNDDQFLAVSGTATNDLWAVGSAFEPATHKTVTLAEHWNGVRWTVVRTPNPAAVNQLLGVFAARPDDVWAVGSSYTFGDRSGFPLIEHWDGRRWTMIAPPSNPYTYVAGLLATGGASSKDVWAVGAGYRSRNAIAETLAFHWDGTHWTYVPSPDVGAENDALDGVAVAPSGDAVAVGSSMNETTTLVERWDGQRWSVDRSAISPPYSQLSGVTIGSDGTVWAAGVAGGKRPFDEFACVP